MLLVVERDPKFTAKLKQHLKIKGLRLFFVETTRDAVFLLENLKADFLLLDLNAVSDWSDLEALEQYATKADIPILVIEGSSRTTELAKRIKSRSRFNFIALPFKVSQLIERIEALRRDKDPLEGKTIGPAGQEVLLMRKLGAGSMGAVYEGTHQALHRKVAVKFLNSESGIDTESGGRFVREARAMAQIRSPHVAQVFFTGKHENTPYLVMEYIDGPDFDKYLRAKGSLSANESVRLIREILQGLADAHRTGLTHRDMKPANVMMNQNGQAVILDFGLVREVSGESLTQAGMILGTPRYISPEQVKGKPVDHRSDLYSVGIMFFEMLVGKPPFQASDLVGLMMKHVQAPLPHPSDFEKDVDRHLFAIVERLCQKQPEHRFASAIDVIEALNEWENNHRSQLQKETAAVRLKAQGGISINESGSLTHSFGSMSAPELPVLQVLLSALNQLQAVTTLGEFQRGIVERDGKRYLLFSHYGGLAALEPADADAISQFHRLSHSEIKAVFESGAHV
ncbi:MAG: protein kinase [Acidobacteria bacterium]|nr:protein kinase [Acidobacteriota bacterium]